VFHDATVLFLLHHLHAHGLSAKSVRSVLSFQAETAGEGYGRVFLSCGTGIHTRTIQSGVHDQLRARMRRGRPPDPRDESLQSVADIGFDFSLDTDTSFAPLWKQSKFKQIVAKGKESSKLTASNYAFSLKEKDLVPEGITYDPRQQKYYVSSVYKRKIVGINMDGTSFDFAGEAQDGLYSTLGMKVDAARNQLWVMGVMNSPKPKMVSASDMGKAAVFQYDLETKKLLKKYALKDTLKHLFNDLVIVNGSVYLTDSENGAIYRIDIESGTFTPFYKWEWMFYPNGITVSQDQQYLFVAHWAGISRIALADTQMIMLQNKPNTTLTGIDGLYFYENKLIAVQNGAGPQSRIMLFELNKTMDAVAKSTLLESQNPLYNVPTTGVIVDDEFFFIANSQLQNFDAQGNIFPPEKMQPTYILKLKLNAKEGQ
jgi:DNA-binding beta-propeller fold protein YncE